MGEQKSVRNPKPQTHTTEGEQSSESGCADADSRVHVLTETCVGVGAQSSVATDRLEQMRRVRNLEKIESQGV